jgi:hypothetical protein
VVVTEILTTNRFVDVIVLSFCCTHFFVCSGFWVLDKSGLGLGRCWRSRTDGHSVVSGLISLLPEGIVNKNLICGFPRSNL